MLSFTAPALVQTWDHWAGDGPPFPFFIFPLFWLLVLAAVVLLLTVGRRWADSRAPRRAGEQALAERFAAGEIDEEQYRSRLSVLRDKK